MELTRAQPPKCPVCEREGCTEHCFYCGQTDCSCAADLEAAYQEEIQAFQAGEIDEISQ